MSRLAGGIACTMPTSFSTGERVFTPIACSEVKAGSATMASTSGITA